MGRASLSEPDITVFRGCSEQAGSYHRGLEVGGFNLICSYKRAVGSIGSKGSIALYAGWASFKISWGWGGSDWSGYRRTRVGVYRCGCI